MQQKENQTATAIRVIMMFAIPIVLSPFLWGYNVFDKMGELLQSQEEVKLAEEQARIAQAEKELADQELNALLCSAQGMETAERCQ
jgi:hypothetical protein